MTKKVSLAAVQMNAQPALVSDRLARAGNLVAQAVQNGAELVVLPELFNTGYEYADNNYTLAESLDGPTLTWMRQTAAQHNIFLAGTLFLLDHEDIYNALFLIGPQGQQWRYNKNYPWMWERAYYRAGDNITIADTPLGKIGMLICWDVAHPALWSRYAGKIDLMLVSSCPPKASDLTFTFPDGSRVMAGDAGLIPRHIKSTAAETFGLNLRNQAATLGVPVVNTTGTGLFLSAIPMPKLSLAAYTISRPDLWRYLPMTEGLRVEAGYFQDTYIADAQGKVLAQVAPGAEHYVVAETKIPESTPQPSTPQPAFGISPFAYMFDEFANTVFAPLYRDSVRTVYGSHMAPLTHQTWRWTAGMALAGILGFVLGRRLRSKA